MTEDPEIFDGCAEGENPMENWNRQKMKDTISRCRILYSRHGHWECGSGWADPISSLSYALEALNITLGKRFGFRIVADQVKEKFGTLRFYYSVERVFPWWTQLLAAPFRFAASAIRRGTRFNCKYSDGRLVPTRMKFLFSLMHFLPKVGRFLDLSFLIPDTKTKDVIMRYLDDTAERLVDNAESECFGRCEVCGDYIGNNWNARCETKGWIRYVCEACAKKNKWTYEKVGGGRLREEGESPGEKTENQTSEQEKTENDNC